MFVIALFTSDEGFKHVSCHGCIINAVSLFQVVKFSFALRCFTLVTVVIKFCGNVLSNIMLSTHR